jgi:anaerobic magnesium-protoporphyrin IX monomethyl ester cyclase
MKILFLNPPALTGEIYMKELGRCGRRAVAGEIWPQTGLAYLAAVVEAQGHKARIIDCMAERMGVERLIQDVKAWNAALIVAGTSTPTFLNDAEVLRRLRTAGRPIKAFCGTHVSALPEQSLEQSDVDFLFINEAEETIKEVADVLSRDMTTQTEVSSLLENIQGLAVRTPTGARLTPPRPYIENLDTLPYPARHLLPNKAYRMPFFEKEPFATVIPTRGCPWQCTFCRAGHVWGRRVRTRSTENVLGEIRHLIEDLGIAKVVFMTDSLTLNKNWAKQFFKAAVSHNLAFDWICNSRVDAVDHEMLDLMKQAGCKLISYGVESGNQEILDGCKKGIRLEDSINAIKWTHQAGILSMAYFVLGLLGETHQTINETITFAKRLNPDYVNFHIATPFPGTVLYEQAAKAGWLTTTNWAEYEEEGSAVMRTADLSPEDLMRAQRRAMRDFYLRPAHLLRELKGIRSKAQLRSRLHAGVRVLNTLFRPK